MTVCVCVCVCRLSLRLSNEKLAWPPEHLLIDTALSGTPQPPDDSVYTASPLDVSIALGME